MTTKQTTVFARLALLCATLIWGSSFVVLKNTIDFLPTNFLLALRFGGACILLSLVFLRQFRNFTKDYLWRGFLIGACLYMAYFTQTIGLIHTTPGKNAFLTAIYCVLVPFLFWGVDRVKPDRYHVSAALICITILQFAAVALISGIVSLCTETVPAGWTENTLPAMAYLTVFCTGVTLLLQNVGQKYLPPSNSAILLSLEAVFGVIFSIILYHEMMTPRLVIGFVLIFISVIISETKLSFLQKNHQEGISR